MWDYNYDYLCHWGIRRFQNEDGSLTSAGKIRYERGQKMDTNSSTDSKVTKRVKKDYNDLSNSDFMKKYATTKDIYRKRVNKYGDPYKHVQEMRSKVHKYTKAFNAASDAEDANDEAWRNVKNQYKNLAKTPIGRMMEVSKAQRGKGSEAANKYLKDWDAASKGSDNVAYMWDDVRRQYKDLGKNRISRILTVSTYNN